MKKVLILASVASMIDQFNMPNIELLQEMGYEVHVACNFKKGSTCTEAKIQALKKRLQAMKVRYFQIDFSRNIFKVREIVKSYQQVKKLLQKERYDFIHCHSPIGGAVGRVAGHKTHTKVIYTAHGFHFYKGAPLQNWLLYYPIEKWLSRYTDVLITINKEDYQRAKKHFHAKETKDIPGVGIDVEKIQAVEVDREAKRRELGIGAEDFFLLSVGELNKNKNHEVVIRALAELHDSRIKYAICGQGPLKGYLEELAEKLGVRDQLFLLGFRTDVIEICKSADVFVFPSKREGLSVALMEAMACGVPCVVSRIRGNVDLVEEGKNGFSYSSNAIENIVNSIVRLREYKKIRIDMGKENIKKISQFDRTKSRSVMSKVYGDTIDLKNMQEIYIKRQAATPKVSVIMGVYNCENTLQKSIDSIINQTYNDWNFIVCDDGSTDKSLTILQEYEHRYPEKFIILSNKKNIGLTKTLNKCLGFSKAEYIARMDADDISLPERIQTQVDFLDAHDEYAMVGCSINKFDENGVWSQLKISGEVSKKDFLWNSPFVHPSVVIRRKALMDVGGYRAEKDTVRCEDYDLWFRLYEKNYKGYNLGKILFNYYEGRDSYKKRKYRYRFNEAIVRWKGYKALKILPGGLLFVIKPLVVGMIPASFLRVMQRRGSKEL